MKKKKTFELIRYGAGLFFNMIFVGVAFLTIALPIWVFAEIAFKFKESK